MHTKADIREQDMIFPELTEWSKFICYCHDIVIMYLISCYFRPQYTCIHGEQPCMHRVQYNGTTITTINVTIENGKSAYHNNDYKHSFYTFGIKYVEYIWLVWSCRYSWATAAFYVMDTSRYGGERFCLIFFLSLYFDPEITSFYIVFCTTIFHRRSLGNLIASFVALSSREGWSWNR